ncbi:MAG: tyrosine-protein phosphatase [Bacteroidales bacterium]|nr:tyrosine-protein phosphatase [Bacteroidales bacterium]
MKKLLAFMLIVPLFFAACTDPNENKDPNDDPNNQTEEVVPVEGTSEWSLIGALLGKNWDTDWVAAKDGDIYFVKNVKLTTADQFKFRKDKAWTENRGADVDVDPLVCTTGQSFPVINNGKNVSVGSDGIYDVYYNAGTEQMVVTIKDGNPVWKKTEDQNPPVDPNTDDLAPEITNGSTILATNPNAEKFLVEVQYPDHNYTYSKVLEYYGGFNGIKYDENGNPDENGETVGNPKSDKPSEYTIRWTPDASAGNMKLVLTDTYWDWTGEESITAGESYVNVLNLVPNTHYTYSVTAENGKVMTQGEFDTYGHLHQVFFKSRVRNARDLGGWKTYDGKMVRYRMLYRGGRLESGTLAKSGKRAIAMEGIKAQLDLRGKSDVLSAPAIDGFAFCAPVIETGGDSMLKSKEKTRQAVQFAIDCAKDNLPMYFNCSLGRDRTGTFALIMLGILDVIEGDISKEYEITYFAPFSWSVSEGEQSTTPYVFRNLRTQWAYKPAAEYIWENYCKKEDGTYDKFSVGMEKYFLYIGISQEDIDEYRRIMLVDPK